MADRTEIEHRRLAILRHLERSTEYTSNGSILTDVLRDVGIASSYEQVLIALAWLDEMELVETVDHGHVVIATATHRGAQVATGAATVPGVKRPAARR